ncbi:histidinol-phosphatase [Marivibrio halodurans]|uniref:Histidinol-phosphatase n=1 Tax=Marivibrio halodurans TaxID=2039722 RepID=A0A8J7S5Q2_9PROT|nr:histidinol-phosphatase [Marivibrio halodurans]MBP5858988.1 histidinol-phosphatase [Marivibrio halodurans]
MTDPSADFVVPEAWLDLAHALADAARPVARRYFRQPLEIIAKADESPVTIADREIEQAMRALIEARFPDHGIFGEEFGRTREDAPVQWVLDPIDGTQAFITGMPIFGTLIAACYQGRPVLGVVDQPILEERWVGAAGHPSTFQGAPIHTSGCADPGGATLYSTHPDMFAGLGRAEDYGRLTAAVKRTRFGGDCYAYGLLASGWADLVVEAMLQPYDYCALGPIVEGAGGAVSDWAGDPLTITSDGTVVAAASPALNVAARGLLNR